MWWETSAISQGFQLLLLTKNRETFSLARVSAKILKTNQEINGNGTSKQASKTHIDENPSENVASVFVTCSASSLATKDVCLSQVSHCGLQPHDPSRVVRNFCCFPRSPMVIIEPETCETCRLVWASVKILRTHRESNGKQTSKQASSKHTDRHTDKQLDERVTLVVCRLLDAVTGYGGGSCSKMSVRSEHSQSIKANQASSSHLGFVTCLTPLLALVAVFGWTFQRV